MKTGRLLIVSILLLLASASAASADVKAPPGAFVSIKQALPGVELDIRYRTSHNFVGRPIKGYRQADCLLTRQAAEALAKVQKRVRSKGYTVKVYDCYRPQRSVADFVRWSKRSQQQRMKREFYPRLAKSRLFKEGYIAEKSGHSRGSTVDLTLVKRPVRKQARYRRGQKLVNCTAPFSKRFRDNSIDMGTGYDCFSTASWPSSRRVGKRQRANRLVLRRAMVKAGFEPLKTEWWHFTLENEPFPERYFDFPVTERSLR